MNRLLLLFWITISFGLVSCEKDDLVIPAENDQTVLMYLPWSNNLTGVFKVNIEDLETAIESGILKNERALVFFQTSETKATLFELTYDNGDCIRETLKEYNNPAVTTADFITSMLNDVQTFAPAKRYGMTIGCHGLGWIPVTRSRAFSDSEQKMHWDYEGELQTRYFGGTKPEYQTDITTLAEGITNAGLKMEYILFDDCYMSTIEVAYDLKEVTDYLIGSTSEIIAYGMPYADMAQYLFGEVDYKGICKSFYNFYSQYSSKPCGTIAVTDCSEVDNMAAVMRKINSEYTFDEKLISSIQKLDGYNPVIFFDYGDYVAKLCTDENLLTEFNAQLEKTVPYKEHTEYYYSSLNGKMTKIEAYSGITISDPSKNSLAARKTETAWYYATHTN